VAKQKNVKINGEDFVLQHPGARWYIKLNDRCQNRFGVLQREKYTDEILDNVVVKPTDIKSLDDFGPDRDCGMDVFNQLMEEAESFLNS
jgi:hypothetical protein